MLVGKWRLTITSQTLNLEFLFIVRLHAFDISIENYLNSKLEQEELVENSEITQPSRILDVENRTLN